MGVKCAVRTRTAHGQLHESKLLQELHTVAVIFEQQGPVAGVNGSSSSLRLDCVVGRGVRSNERHFVREEVVVSTVVCSSCLRRDEYFLSALGREGTIFLR
jgi:hypothetical protein